MKSGKRKMPLAQPQMGSPFSQFNFFCYFTDQLGRVENRNVDFLTSVLKEIDQTKGRNALNYINKLRAINIIRNLQPENRQWHEESAEITANLKAVNYWVERTWDETPTSREITIFAPLPFHMSNVEDSARLAHSYNRRTIDASKNAISKIIDRAHEALESYGKSEFSDLILDRDGLISEYFSAIADIHHEITDNAYRHALRSPLTNIWLGEEGENISFFGDTLYLQINRLTVSASGSVVLEKSSSDRIYPNSLQKYIDERIRKDPLRPYRGPRRLLSFSYADNGPGPLRHFKKYAPKEVSAKVSTLSEIFRMGISSRPDIKGSGSGFSNMISAASNIKGYVCVRSGNVTVYYDGNKNEFGEEVDENIENERGTMVFFMFGI